MTGMREQLTELLTKLDVYNCEECRNYGMTVMDLLMVLANQKWLPIGCLCLSRRRWKYE